MDSGDACPSVGGKGSSCSSARVLAQISLADRALEIFDREFAIAGQGKGRVCS